MITISLCLIAKNEEKTIGRCLESIKGVIDEIILVDTGSTDRTKEIASKYTSQIFDFKWIDDFSAARNFSFRQATKEYILWLDADDILLPVDQEKLKKLKETFEPSTDVVTMIYHYAFDEYDNPTLSFRRERLVRRANDYVWVSPIHEHLDIRDGTIFNSDIIVTHRRIKNSPGRNLAIYEKRLSKGEKFSARDHYYYANELFDNRRFEKAIKHYQIFLSMKDAWVEDKICACGRLADCYRFLGKSEKEKEAIYQSFDYAPPRAEFCCMLGLHFLEKENLENAIFWYMLATQMEKPKNEWAFYSEPHWTWLPHLQLCLCYAKQGNLQQALHHNEIARSQRPDDPQILHNKKLFDQMLRNK